MHVSAASAQEARSEPPSSVDERNASTSESNATSADREAERRVHAARGVIEDMKRDPQVTKLLARAKGVFIVPSMRQATGVAGERDGKGVLLVNNGEEWRGPAFFGFDRVDDAARDADGAVAMLLMSANAVSRFTVPETDFSLGASSGLAVTTYSKQGNANGQDNVSAGRADIVMWANTDDLRADDPIGISSIARDADETMAYYGHAATPQEIFSGVVATEQGAELRQALPTHVATR